MDDLISRHAAIEHWRLIIDATSTDSGYNMGFVDGLEFCISHLSTMPSAQPERPTGEWIYQTKFGRIECKACGHVFRSYVYPRNFCPNCGADMRGDKHETD